MDLYGTALAMWAGTATAGLPTRPHPSANRTARPQRWCVCSCVSEAYAGALRRRRKSRMTAPKCAGECRHLYSDQVRL